MTTPCCAVQKQINRECIKDSMRICWTDHLKWTSSVSKSSKKQCWVYLFVCLFKPVSVHNTKIMSLSCYLWFKTLSFLKPTLLVNFYMANFIWIHSIKMACPYFGQWCHCPHCCSLTLVPTWLLQSSRPTSPSHALLPLPPKSTITSHPSQGPRTWYLLAAPYCKLLIPYQHNCPSKPKWNLSLLQLTLAVPTSLQLKGKV